MENRSVGMRSDARFYCCFLLASSGGICDTANISCYIWINEMGTRKVEQA